MKIPNCKNFTGYKPCEPYKVCEPDCEENPPGTRILIINLDALGDVLMTTAQLPAIKRKYPQSTIRWITRANAAPLLENNPYLDEVLIWNDESRMILRHMKFDVVMNADKSREAGAFIMELKAEQKLGFGINENGAIIPLNRGAWYNYQMGLDDELKFRHNQKTGQEILAETFELEYCRDPYIVHLTPEEHEYCQRWRQEWQLHEADCVIGFNTGCSELFPLKKLSVEQHIELIETIASELPNAKILLLGGKEDTRRNQQIKDSVGDRVINTPTTLGVRKGLCFVNLCDAVVTGDTLGMHMAIALKKYVIAWFGLSCAQEIDLYDRGVKIIRKLPCAPCWKQVCDQPQGPICVTQFDLNEIVQAVKNFYRQHQKQEAEKT